MADADAAPTDPGGGAQGSARAAILGPVGPVLGPEERAFYARTQPWGFILFARSIEAPDQVFRLTQALREAVGRNAPILIDQEGGRVARLRPPHWRGWPAAERHFAPGGGGEAALRLRFRLIAAELQDLGIDVNCMPILDVPSLGAHPIIDDRVLGRHADEIARRGRIVCEALRAGGVLPVVKHMPGHGRAGADSHQTLPEIAAALPELEATDFAPFRALNDQPLGMTAHLRYTALDGAAPATFSPEAIGAIRAQIGFDGLLMTDDIGMGALAGLGEIPELGRKALAAGCDVVLHCNGDLAEMEALMETMPVLSGTSAARAGAALAARRPPEPFDRAEALRSYDALTREIA